MCVCSLFFLFVSSMLDFSCQYTVFFFSSFASQTLKAWKNTKCYTNNQFFGKTITKERKNRISTETVEQSFTIIYSTFAVSFFFCSTKYYYEISEKNLLGWMRISQYLNKEERKKNIQNSNIYINTSIKLFQRVSSSHFFFAPSFCLQMESC